MSTLTTILRVGGVVAAAVGLMFLPVRNYVFDKGDLSAFHDASELGTMLGFALGLIAVGLLAFALSFAIRGGLGG
jgi:hypothetical protein